jgi:hypothetical protein
MTLVNTFLTSCANEAGGDLAVVNGHFFLSDEKVDLTGTGVLHSGHEVFAGAQIVLRRYVGGFRYLGSRNGAGRTKWSNGDTRRDRGNRGRRAGLLEEHSPADFFHWSSLRVLGVSVVEPTSDEIVVKIPRYANPWRFEGDETVNEAPPRRDRDWGLEVFRRPAELS